MGFYDMVKVIKNVIQHNSMYFEAIQDEIPCKPYLLKEIHGKSWQL